MSKLARDVMTPDPVSVSPEATLREVAEVLSTNHIGGVPVVTGAEHLVGVVSASDLMEFLAAEPGVPTDRPDQTEWGEPGLGPDGDEMDESDEATRYFADLWVDAGADLLERFSTLGSPEWNELDEHTAEEIMTRKVITLPPDVEVQEIARNMLEHSIHRLFIVEDGRLAGVVSTRDIVALVAGRERVARTARRA